MKRSFASQTCSKFFEYLLKPKSKLEVTSLKWDLINIGELIGCTGALLSVLGFILIYIFGTVDRIFTVESIAKIFVFCYGSFLLLHTIYSISKAIKGQGKLGEFIQGISLMILFPSIFIILLFFFKMIAEVQSGLTLEEVDKANEGLIIYWIYLIKAIIISGGFWIFSMLINLIFKARE